MLLGQSVGSGPTCELASKLGEDLGGVILHSPLASGVRVLKPTVTDRWPVWLDIYPNFKFVQVCLPPLPHSLSLSLSLPLSHSLRDAISTRGMAGEGAT